MLPILIPLFLLLAPSPTQEIGGGSELLFEWDGGRAVDYLGHSVSGAGDVNGDGYDDLIIGAYAATPSGVQDAGAAYIYSGMDGSLIHLLEGSFYSGWLGYSVSGAGDVNADGFADVIVGAINDSPGGIANAGSAYVYSGLDASILFQFDGVAVDDAIGDAISDAGDVNGDGFADVIVGAPWQDPGGLHSAGSAFVYSGADGSLLYQWDGTIADEEFGYSVSGAQDVNGDGYDDLIVGAARFNPGGRPNAGSAFVFSGVDGSLIHRLDGEAQDDSFGWSVSDTGDVDGDGFADIFIGAHYTTAGGTPRVGSAYLHSGATGALIYKFDGTESDDKFGWSVSGPGDVNGDAIPDLLVGARGANPVGRPNTGAVYIYSGSDGSLIAQRYGEESNNFFGNSVSGAGDVNMDGLADIIVGAFAADPGGRIYAGSAYAFSYSPYLQSNTRAVSASNGGVLSLTLNFPFDAAFDHYKVLISETGTGPTFYGTEIPLTLDHLVGQTFFGSYPVMTYSNMHGTLNASGNASASLTLPSGIPSALIGKTYYLAAIANPPGRLPEFSSVAVAVEITP